MLRSLLKSKIHRALVTDANVEYEGSISIPADLMEEAGLWDGEKVLVASVTSGNRLETYVQTGEAGSGEIVMNGGAAHRIKSGEIVAIMAFALSDKPITPRKLLCDRENRVVRS